MLINEDEASFQAGVADRLAESAGLFAGPCPFTVPSGDTLEDRRAQLVADSLVAARQIFEQALATEAESVPLLEALVSHVDDHRPTTRLQAQSKAPPKTVGLDRTPLQELYCGDNADEMLDEGALWQQLLLRHHCVMGWVKQTLDTEEDLDDDVLAERKQAELGLSAGPNRGPDAEMELDPSALEGIEFDAQDLEDLSSLEDDDEDEDELSSDTQQLSSQADTEPNQSYVTGLNDADDTSSDDEEADDDEPDDEAEAAPSTPQKQGRRAEENMSLDSLESRSGTETRPKRRRSAVDDDFFSLAEFEEEAHQGESQMRRQLRRLSGQDGQPEDEESEKEEEEEDVDLFAKYDSGLLEEDDEDENSDQMDLDSVADLRYNDFFAPIARQPTKKGKKKAGPAPGSTATPPATKTPQSAPASKGKSPRVMFSEQVTVKEIPAKNKGLRVSDMLGSNDDDEEGEEDDDFQLGSESEESEEASDAESEEDDDDHSSSASQTDGSDDEPDGNTDAGQKTMGRFSRDLFDDEPSGDGSGSAGSGPEEAGELSRHARKMQMLSRQIAELEAENVAKKDWTLKGEAGARDRPQNSLLEEDLEFEHVQKIAPAVTEEKTLGLEALIKQRVVDGQYDDVVRRRPIDPKAFLPSRLLELQDTQASKSLTEIYEDEYRGTKARAETGVGPVDAKDAELSKEHSALKVLFEDLCGKLDALSNAHFTPKAPKATITTLNNLPTVALESALPTATGSGTLLAPEEIFSANAKDVQRDTSELTHAQKQADRQRRKEARKNVSKKVEAATGKKLGDVDISKLSTKQQKERSLEQLAATKGVSIIGKRSNQIEQGPKKARKLESGAAYKL